MIEINLLPAQFRKKEKKEFKVPELPYRRIFVFFIIFLLVLEGFLFLQVVQQKSRLSEFRNEFKGLEPDIQRIRSIKSETSRLQARLRRLEGMYERPFYWTRLLNDISDSMTEGVWLTEISVQKKVQMETRGSSRGKRLRKSAIARGSREKGAEGQTEEETEYLLVMRGFIVSTPEGTAPVGKFVQSLQANTDLREVVSDIWLEKINRADTEKAQLFEFNVSCFFKEEYSEHFDAVY